MQHLGELRVTPVKPSVLCRVLSLILGELWGEGERCWQVLLSTNRCSAQAPPTHVFIVFKMTIIRIRGQECSLSLSCFVVLLCLVLFLLSHHCFRVHLLVLSIFFTVSFPFPPPPFIFTSHSPVMGVLMRKAVRLGEAGVS